MSTSKLEYLKRYIESDNEPKKKKVRKVKRIHKNPNIKIFDTNVDLKDVEAGSECDDPAVEDIRENAPEVAEVIDDRSLDPLSFKKTFQEAGKSGSDDEDLSRRGSRIDTSSKDASKHKPSRARHDSSDDSPPRPLRARRDSSHERPSKKGRRDSSDESPPRRKKMGSRSHAKDSDESPPRWKRDSDIDSPPRRPRRHHVGDREIVPCEVVEGPETVSLRRGKNEEELAAKREEAEKQARRKAIYDKWTAGLVQQQQKQSQMEDILTEANKPLARSANDDDLEDRLKAMDRDGDPMLAFLKKKKLQPGRPRYNGPQPPPNRYNIWPGYRWDGVDRSNGFEAKMMAMKNDKMANEEQAYKWSIEDM